MNLPDSHPPFFAREQETVLLARTLLSAEPGAAWYVCGSPGQGKSFFAGRLLRTLQELSKEPGRRFAVHLVPAFHSFPLTAAEWMDSVLLAATAKAVPEAPPRQLIILADDFDQLVQDQLSRKESAALRDILSEKKDILLVALGRPESLPKLSADPAWEGFFTPFSLPPLTNDQCQELFQSISGMSMPGDSPRFLAVLSGRKPAIVHACALSGSDDPVQWIGQMEKKYKHFHRAVWDALPPLERRVLHSVCQWRGPVLAATVAGETGLSVNEASALLGRLAGRGILSSERNGRANAYSVADRAFLLCRAFVVHPGSRQALTSFFSFCMEVYRGGLLLSPVIDGAGGPKGMRDRRPGYQPVFPGPCETDDEGPVETGEARPEPRIDDLLLPSPDFPALVNGLLREGHGAPGKPDVVLEQAAEDNPEDPEAWELYAGFLHRVQGKGKEAEEIYLKALELDANRPSVWMGLGLLLQDVPEREVEAEQAYRIAVSLSGDNPSARALLGRFFARDPERLALAEKELSRAVELKPDFGAAWLALSEIFAGNPDLRERAEEARLKAEAGLERERLELLQATGIGRAVEKKRNSDLSREACRMLRQGGESLPAAAATFERLARSRPEDAWAWAMLGYCLLLFGSDRARCRAAVQKALSLDPKLTLALCCMGELSLAEGKEQEAFYFFERAGDRPDAGGLVFARLGQRAAEAGDARKAEELFRNAISLEPDEPWAYAHLGRLLLDVPQRLPDARKALGRAVSLCPDYALARLWLARALEALGERGLAYAELQEAVMADPSGYGPWEALIVFSVEKLKDGQAAEDFARQYLERADDRAAARRNLERTIAERGLADIAGVLGKERAEGFPGPEKGASILAQAGEKAAAGDLPGALALAAPLFGRPTEARGSYHAMASLFMSAASAGHGEEALAALAAAPGEAAETLAAAVGIMMGREPGPLPPEMLLAARDLAGVRSADA